VRYSIEARKNEGMRAFTRRNKLREAHAYGNASAAPWFVQAKEDASVVCAAVEESRKPETGELQRYDANAQCSGRCRRMGQTVCGVL